MAYIFFKTLLSVPAVSGFALTVLGNTALAASLAEETVADTIAPEPVRIAQVTSVTDLSDVEPGDWAFTALQRLVEEYGCLEGYPNSTYRGHQALTRSEFAAGLNACLDVVVQLTGSGDNLDTVRRLQNEFAAELAMVRSQVDVLETDVAALEANQFSTTTKLRGVLNAHLVVPFTDATLVPDTTTSNDPTRGPSAVDGIVGGPEADAAFEYWGRLQFDTSFTGEDRLLLSVSATDAAGLLANTESGLNYTTDRIGMRAGNVGLDDIYYRFPVGDRITLTIAANSILTEDLVSSVIVPFSSYAVAAAGLPEFYFLYTGGDFSAGTNIELSDSLVLDLAYLSATDNENPEERGLFNSYTYLAQLNLLTDGILDAAVIYLDGNQTTTVADEGPGMLLTSQVNPEYTIAGMLSLDFGKVILAGHYAYSPAKRVDGDLNSYMGGLAFPDLLGEGNELGIYGGISPAVDRDPLLIEAYYRVHVNEFLSLTPALIYANNNSGIGNEDNFYGAVRATFQF